MPHFLTLYLQNSIVDKEFKAYESSNLIQTWSSRPILSKMDIRKDDTIYWVTVRQGVLHLIMAMVVGEKILYENFAQRYGRGLADWEKDHGEWFYIASKGTTIETNRDIDFTDVKKIKTQDGRNLTFNPPQGNLLDRQTLRNPRFLSEESAEILNKYLEFEDVTPQHFAEWIKVLNVGEIEEKIEREKMNASILHEKAGGYLPTREDIEYAYRSIAYWGQEVNIEDLLNKIEENMRIANKVLDPNWRSITKENIPRLFKKG